jgi:hypothetical protein
MMVNAGDEWRLMVLNGVTPRDQTWQGKILGKWCFHRKLIYKSGALPVLCWITRGYCTDSSHGIIDLDFHFSTIEERPLCICMTYPPTFGHPIGSGLYLGISINGSIQNGWFIIENPITKMDDSKVMGGPQ